MQEARQALLR